MFLQHTATTHHAIIIFIIIHVDIMSGNHH